MSEAKGKIFENENDGILLEFATGLKEYCRNHADCKRCIFATDVDPVYPARCKISYPMNWRV